jgi:hypothetical protein
MMEGPTPIRSARWLYQTLFVDCMDAKTMNGAPVTCNVYQNPRGTITIITPTFIHLELGLKLDYVQSLLWNFEWLQFHTEKKSTRGYYGRWSYATRSLWSSRYLSYR